MSPSLCSAYDLQNRIPPPDTPAAAAAGAADTSPPSTAPQPEAPTPPGPSAIRNTSDAAPTAATSAVNTAATVNTNAVAAAPQDAAQYDGTAAAATTSHPAAVASTAAAVDWSRVRLGIDPAPTMFVANWSTESGCWDGGELVPYGPLGLLPAAQVLNYGQSIFEGLKAYRRDGAAATDADAGCSSGGSGSGGGNGDGVGCSGGGVLLFRPRANAARFEAGAVRMCMPPVPPDMFVAAVHAVVRANADWVPPASRGSLYLRPLLLGTGPLLGLCPAPSYTFVVYAVPVGGRAKEGRLTSLNYLIHDSIHRAAPRGVGATKAAGNYSPCLLAQAQAREQGCHDCIYLDARSDTYLEEGSGCNVFAAHGSVLTTPPVAGSILPGITRASLLQLAGALGYGVREVPLTVKDAMRADEMFASGTAVVVQPIGSLTHRGRNVALGSGGGRTMAATADGQVNNHPPTATTANGHLVNGHAADSNGQLSSDCNGCGGAAAAEPRAGMAAAAEAEAEEGEGEDQSGPGSPGAATCRVLSYGCANGTVSELRPEQRAALAAVAPIPEPGSLPPGVGPIAQRLYGLLTSIQYGRVPDPFGWIEEVDMVGPKEGLLHLDRLLGLEVEAEEEAGGAEGASQGQGMGIGKIATRPHRSVFADPNLE